MIAGYFGLNLSQAMPTVLVSLRLPGITKDVVAVEFLVDTGATNPFLHPLDSITRVGIDRAALADPSVWPTQHPVAGIGGNATYYRHEAVYIFTHDDGSEQRITRSIHIARPSASNSKLPSLLGTNILRHFKVSIDYASQRVILE